jgi:hypothetical protein
MAAEIATGRGVYRLLPAAQLEYDDSGVVLALAMERADGIERVVTRFRIARELAGELPEVGAIIEQLKGWLAREFETTREAALKSIRSERRLHEITFDQANPGPFTSH